MTNTLQPTDQKKKPGLFKKSFRLVVLLVALVTILSGWGGIFNPAKYWFVAVIVLGFPIISFINLSFFFVLLSRRRIYALVPLTAFFITLIKLPLVFQYHTDTAKPAFIEDQSPEVKLMTFNVRLFDLYNWTHNQQTRLKIFDFLAEQQPDILCLQEFYTDETEFNNLKELHEIMKADKHHVEYPFTLNKTEHWGIATISSYPILNKGVIKFAEKSANICIFTDMLINKDTIRVYNCHLQSVRLDNKDYQFIENFGQEDEQTVKRTKFIVGRLKKAFIKRAYQVGLITEHIRKSPYPTLVCGDFNDTSLSYTYSKISELLTDAWRESGKGLGTTYVGPIPGLRIDYIFHSNEISSYEFTTHSLNLSDHQPVSATIIINP